MIYSLSFPEKFAFLTGYYGVKLNLQLVGFPAASESKMNLFAGAGKGYLEAAGPPQTQVTTPQYLFFFCFSSLPGRFLKLPLSFLYNFFPASLSDFIYSV